ncbi:MAG: hypothetical protein OEY38_19330 [Gammaproteobacteria bacterium]|nr:hypothetical protein [Gammaproteobacteria bacterium]
MDLKKSFTITISLLLLILTFSPAIADDENDEMLVFERGITLNIDGDQYMLAGVADTDNGNTDVPGHSWAKVGKKKLIGKHVNTGPNGAASWWSSDAENGSLLYLVNGRVDEWTMANSIKYFMKGFTHYHPLLAVKDGSMHPTKVLWLKHIATQSFTQDGGPHPELSHSVSPGPDWQFVPNWNRPYTPMPHHDM